MMPDSLDLTAANILGYARKYSFYADDQAPDYRAANETQLAGAYQGFRHTLVDGGQKVARLTVQRQLNSARGADFLIKPKITALTGTPAYFLPWDARGAAVEMTIPRFAIGDDEVANPPIFFTAALSGCSIIFKGTATKPTIFHCGTAGGGSGASTVGDSNQFFRSMLLDIEAQRLGRFKYNLGTQVLSSHYMTTTLGGGDAPGHQAAFENKLRTHYTGRLGIENVNIWGTILGFRTGTQWEFYLQENATVVYYKYDDVVNGLMNLVSTDRFREIDLANLTSGQVGNAVRKTGAKVNIQARPAVVRQVFPVGPAVATVASRWQTLGTL